MVMFIVKTILTCGLWILYIAIRHKRRRKRWINNPFHIPWWDEEFDRIMVYQSEDRSVPQ